MITAVRIVITLKGELSAGKGPISCTGMFYILIYVVVTYFVDMQKFIDLPFYALFCMYTQNQVLNKKIKQY